MYLHTAYRNTIFSVLLCAFWPSFIVDDDDGGAPMPPLPDAAAAAAADRCRCRHQPPVRCWGEVTALILVLAIR